MSTRTEEGSSSYRTGQRHTKAICYTDQGLSNFGGELCTQEGAVECFLKYRFCLRIRRLGEAQNPHFKASSILGMQTAPLEPHLSSCFLAKFC